MSKKKSSFLHALAGNPSGRPLVPEPVVAAGVSLDPPDGMSDAEAEGWRYIVANAPAGMLRSLDTAALSAWCTARVVQQRAALAFRDQPITIVKGKSGVVINPLFNALDKATLTFLRASRELGFTPTARGHVKTHNDAPAASRFATLKSA